MDFNLELSGFFVEALCKMAAGCDINIIRTQATSITIQENGYKSFSKIEKLPKHTTVLRKLK